MRIQPRQQLLELWRATAAYSFHDGEWRAEGQAGQNSIADAEQLLCLMYPASEIPWMKLDQPDKTATDVLDALGQLGNAVDIPKALVRAVAGYMDRYESATGTPTFAGGSYFQPRNSGEVLTPAQHQMDVVDSFSMSITLTLTTLGFIKVFRRAVRRKQLLEEVDALEAMASRRLTAAMIGLLRSFTVHSFAPASEEGLALLRAANQNRSRDKEIVAELHASLAQVRAGLLDVTLGSGGAEALDNEGHLFECGWSWGVVADAPRVEIAGIPGQPEGLAPARPFLYFTIIALDGITDLFSKRTQILGLLNNEQQTLARWLQLRWELTQQYWAAIATFGTGRWPLEDIPWRTTDGRESDYYSLLVTAIVTTALVNQRAADPDLGRVATVLEELAVRGRVTRRPLLGSDESVRMHAPGVQLNLYGAERLGPEAVWPVTDFAPTLLKRAVGLASIARGPELRGRLLDLADDVWQHVLNRRQDSGVGKELWDEPGNVFPDLPSVSDAPSWYYTERVVECLVAAAAAVSDSPLRNDRLVAAAKDLLNEADHLYNQELLAGSPSSGIAMQTSLARLGARLERAREVLSTLPGTAMAILYEVLKELDELTTARQGPGGSPL